MANLCITASLRNVRANQCDIQMKALAYLIVTKRKLTESELQSSDTLKAALSAGAILGRADVNKVFPFPKFSDVTDNTGETPRETLGDGRIQTGVEPAPSYAGEMPIGFCQAQALRAFNGYAGGAYVVDSDGVFFFVNDGQGGQPFSLQELSMGIPRWGAFTGRRVVTLNVSFADANQFNNVSALRLDQWTPADLASQEDAEIYEAAAATGYVFTLGARVKCSNEEVYAAYADVLDDPALWDATRLDTNASVTITTVVKDDVNQGWDFTLSSSPTIATGTKIRFELDLLALKAAGITLLEGLPLVVAKPA